MPTVDVTTNRGQRLQPGACRDLCSRPCIPVCLLFFCLALLVQILCSVFEYGYPIERDITENDGLFKLNTAFKFSTYEPPPTKQRPQSASMMSVVDQPMSLPNMEFDINATELLRQTPKVWLNFLLSRSANIVTKLPVLLCETCVSWIWEFWYICLQTRFYYYLL